MSGVNVICKGNGSISRKEILDTAALELHEASQSEPQEIAFLNGERIPQHGVEDRIQKIFIDETFAFEGATAQGKRVSISTDGIQVPPSLSPQKLRLYLSHLSFLLTQQSSGDYILKTHVRGVGGGNGMTKEAIKIPVQKTPKTPDEKLVNAIQSGDINRAKLAVAEGASANASMLDRALKECPYGKLSMVQYLQSAGAKPSPKELSTAIANKEFSIASSFIKEGVASYDCIKSYLINGLKNRDLALIDFCLKNGGNPSIIFEEERKLGADDISLVYASQEQWPENPLLAFNSSLISQLPVEGTIMDVLELAATAKRYPIRKKNNERLLSLLERGVDFNKIDDSMNRVISYGMDCIERYKVTELLIKSKAKLVSRHLQEAVLKYDLKLISLLISSGLKPNLDLVIITLPNPPTFWLPSRYCEMSKLLFDAGAPVNLSDEERKRVGAHCTPLCLAINNTEYHGLIPYLLEKGADISKLPRNFYPKIPAEIQDSLFLKLKTDSVFLKAMEALAFKIMDSLPNDLLEKLAKASKNEELKTAIINLFGQTKKIIFGRPLLLGLEDNDLPLERKEFATSLSKALATLLSKPRCFDPDKKTFDSKAIQEGAKEAIDEWYSAAMRLEEQKMKQEKMLESQQMLLHNQTQTNNQLEDSQKRIQELQESIRLLKAQMAKQSTTQSEAYRNMESQLNSQLQSLELAVRFNTAQMPARVYF